MTPGARLAAAIEVFADIEGRRRPAADALKDWGLAHRFAGSKDRAAIASHCYDALRRRASSAFLMGADTPRATLLGSLSRARGLKPDAIAALCTGEAHAPEALSEGLVTLRFNRQPPPSIYQNSRRSCSDASTSSDSFHWIPPLRTPPPTSNLFGLNSAQSVVHGTYDILSSISDSTQCRQQQTDQNQPHSPTPSEVAPPKRDPGVYMVQTNKGYQIDKPFLITDFE